LRYTQHAITAAGISSEAIKKEFATHAREEQAHMMAVAGRAVDDDLDKAVGFADFTRLTAFRHRSRRDLEGLADFAGLRFA
jgi:hypothetical protein